MTDRVCDAKEVGREGASSAIASRDPVGEAVRLLREGRIVGLPTETVYGLAAASGDPPPAKLHHSGLAAAKGGTRLDPLSVAVADLRAAERIAPLVPVGARRLADRFWPGPLTLVLDRAGAPAIGLRVPADRVAQAVLRHLGEPLFLTSANRSGEPPAIEARTLAETFSPDEVPFILDGGRSPVGEASTVVRFEGSRARILRAGLIDAPMVWRVAATKVLLVCTGNTCRSPMAALLFREAWARALDIDADRLLEYGGWVESAGVSAIPGIRASAEAITIMAERGLDLGSHRSNAITRESMNQSHRVYTLTRSHLEQLRNQFPEISESDVTLLDPTGSDIQDPIGGTEADYRHCAEAIDAAVRIRVRELI